MQGDLTMGTNDRKSKNARSWKGNKRGHGTNITSGQSFHFETLNVEGTPIRFRETNFDWSQTNIFRTRLCDRLAREGNCHMTNRCLFSHDPDWLRRTPFLPRSTQLTLRYIPVFCPAVGWPRNMGVCTEYGHIKWDSDSSHSKFSGRSDNCNSSNSHSPCSRGENCPFVHSIDEFLFHPEIYKTRMCFSTLETDEQNKAAMCPWYFCPFAHDKSELRLFASRGRPSAPCWQPPPQIADNYYIAHTQGFTALECRIIKEYKANYKTTSSPEHLNAYIQPVLWAVYGKPFDTMLPLAAHREMQPEPRLFLMLYASLLSLNKYSVENYYTPGLLSIQCMMLSKILGPPYPPDESCGEIINRFPMQSQSRKYLRNDDVRTPSVISEANSPSNSTGDSDVNAILEILDSQGIFQVMELLCGMKSDQTLSDFNIPSHPLV